MKLESLIVEFTKLKEILSIVEREFSRNTDPAHDFSHVRRVVELASEIASSENVPVEPVAVAALLHDVKRPEEDLTGLDHARTGSEFADGLLRELKYGEEFIKTVCEAVRDHRYRLGRVPRELTGKVLQDADKLDAIGAVAIARVFARSGKLGRPLHSEPKAESCHKNFSESAIAHFREKILKITPETFWTFTARGLAKDRYDFTVEFVGRFLREWDGCDFEH